MRHARRSRFMVSTQQVWEKVVWGQTRNGLHVFGIAESSGCVYTKDSRHLSTTPLLEHRNIDHTTESTVGGGIDLTTQIDTTNQLRHLPTHGLSNHVRIHASHNREHGYQDSFTLCRCCTHFAWVMTILNSQILILTNQVVSSLVWLWWVIDLASFEFESGIVSLCFSFTFVLFRESHLLVSWCAGGRCGMTCSDEDHDRSRRPGVEDRGWSHRSGTRWSGDREVRWHCVLSAPCMWRRGAQISWLIHKTKVDGLSVV
jgi:hypothetical protein